MAALAADTVGPLLRDRETRAAALDALEAHAVPIERPVSLGAAPALGELLALDVAEVGPADFDRIGLLLGRLTAEASDDPASVLGAAMGEGRLLAFFRSEGNALAQSDAAQARGGADAGGRPAPRVLLYILDSGRCSRIHQAICRCGLRDDDGVLGSGDDRGSAVHVSSHPAGHGAPVIAALVSKRRTPAQEEDADR
jgi:hypothetical protein